MKLVTVLLFLVLSFNLHSAVSINEVSVQNLDGSKKLNINFNEPYREVPSYKKKGSEVEFYFPKTFLDAKAKISFDGKIKNEKEGVYIFLALNAEQVRSLEATATAKKLSYRYNSDFVEKSNSVEGVEEKNNEKNTEYLSYLMDSVSEKKSNTISASEDPIKLNESSEKKLAGESNFDIPAYIAKAVFVLIAIILFFIATVQIFKKFALRKGKLNFLKGDKVIEVLATNYIAPKRTLMLLRVHEQIILVANTESGINLLTEVQDTTGLLKQGEKLLTGGNFDTEVELSHTDQKLNEKVKLKDLTKLSQSQSELSRWKSFASFKNRTARSN